MDDPSKFGDSITPIWSCVLDAPPSCLEFVPRNHNPDFEYFIVGTYTLLATGEEAQQSSQPQEKVGGLKLFRIDHGKMILVQEMVYKSAIFDLHFLPNSSHFAVVTNTGDISIFNFSQDEQGIAGFEHAITHHLTDAQITYFAWHPYGGENPPLLAATLHTGRLLIVRFGDWGFSRVELLDDDEETLASMHGHDESAWCCAWSSPTSANPAPGGSGRTLFTGGDDCTLRLFTMATVPIIPDSVLGTRDPDALDSLDVGRRVFKPHSSGVTFILPLPISTSDVACIFLTGGYDDLVRVYTTYDFREGARTYTRPKVLAELNLGGGVWRLKFLQDYEKLGRPDDASQPVRYKVLASCAYAGARIVEIEGSLAGEWSIKVVGTVTVHESMCYASDVQPLQSEDDTLLESRICVSSSFYDKLLCLWKWDPARAVVEAASSSLG